MANIWGDFKRGRIGVFFGNDPSLVAYWQLDKNAFDNSGNGWNGTEYNLVRDGKVMFRDGITAPYFNGSNSKVVMPTPNFNFSQITLMAWVLRMGDANTSDGKIIDIKGSNYRSVLAVGNPGGATGAYFQVFTGGGDYYSAAGFDNDIYIPRVSLMVGSYNGSSVFLFINNKIYDPKNASGTLILNSSFYIGQEAGDGAPRYFNGYICEAAVFNRGLSPSEISQYYNWAISSPKKYWIFTTPSLELSSSILFPTSLRLTEKVGKILNVSFPISRNIKEIVPASKSINFPSSSNTVLGKIVQGIVRRIFSPKGGGIIKNR
ncbi:MAG: hypothetical protein KatS3mg096_768 [Candidatus Parcubacteria bacterium]|nr:MAG: hypothetical protein KatS3mg096_768 [Candidatus Parcubacteria bacterium]